MYQVIGDLWERYLEMLDDSIQDGYVDLDFWIGHVHYSCYRPQSSLTVRILSPKAKV